jgi:hypothetical protein
MGKLFFLRLVATDWFNDTRELSPEAKGAWIDSLLLMLNAPVRGRWQGTYQEYARATGIAWEMAPRIIDELGKRVATVTLSNNIVTLECRRMRKEDSAYKSNANRQARFRRNANSNAIVTHKTLEAKEKKKTLTSKTLTSTTLEEETSRHPAPACPKGLPPDALTQKQIQAQDFEAQVRERLKKRLQNVSAGTNSV